MQSSASPRSSPALSLSRPRVGLVLGAGGIRGCAHAGVIEVLEEAGVPVDLVVGASVGSIFGLGVAAGVPAAEIARSVCSLTTLDMLRFYGGRLRPSRGNPMARLIRETAAGKDFEDLPLPFGVAATDMATHRPVLFSSGPVLPALQASFAVPFVARPVRLNGTVYTDGGLVDTTPVAFARRLGADVVIAVLLGSNYYTPHLLRGSRTRTVLERLARQPFPVTDRLHHQLRFGARLWLAGMNPPVPALDADAVIVPHFGHLSPNAPSGARFCYEQGLAAARDALPTVQSVIVNHYAHPESP